MKSCDRCQRASTKFDKATPTLQNVPVPPKAWTQIGIYICSLIRTPEGFVGIVVAVDYFTKWVEAQPIMDKSSVTIAEFIYGLICRHGCSRIQINHQGREFVNTLAEELFKMTGVKQIITSAYHPQSNGLVERNNRTIQNSMLKILKGENEKWPSFCREFFSLYRTTKQASTGFTPFFLIYGREAILPCHGNDLSLHHEEDSEDQHDLILDESQPDDIKERLSTIMTLKNTITNMT